MTYEPEKRISAKQALNDPWICHQCKKSPLKPERMLKSLDYLENCKITTSIHKAVLTYISVRTITREKEDKLRAVFTSLDKNNDGQLSRSELTDAFNTYYDGNQDLSRKKVDKLMKQIDINKNGLIDYNGNINAPEIYRISYCTNC